MIRTVDASARRVLLLLGSNVNADQQLDAALQRLRAQFELTAVSQRHLSPATGDSAAPAYLNQAAIIASAQDRGALKSALRAIEATLGRQRPSPDARLCPIDIDAVARLVPDLEIWDAESYDASYALAPLQDLGLR